MASKLLKLNSHEAENQFELSLRQAFDLLQPIIRPPFQLTIPNPQEYSHLNLAILYGVLIEPHVAITHVKHLHAKVTDGYALFVSLLVKVCDELFLNLVDCARIQLIWAAKQMVDVFGVGFDGLLVCLLRQIVGGEFGDGNLWLCSELVSVFLSRWDLLLEEEPMVLTYALYVFLRLLGDHCRVLGNAKLDALKRLEIGFCVKMLREKFHLCLKIGRDLIRLLQDLVSVPEFESVWKDIVLNPEEFRTPGFSSISQIYSSRTSSRYFLLRITPEMETQLRFLLTHVKFGSQKRYQVWFAKKFFSCPERKTLIIDIVRFICCAHHPSNEILQSEIFPRWAVIGWLLSCCQNDLIQNNARLSLFYDWLFFDERADNIMNIEPGMLLMACSIPKYIEMTHSLLDFLLLLVEYYDVDHKDVITRGVLSSFNMLVQKGVVPSMHVLISCTALSPFIKEKLLKILSASNAVVPKEVQPSMKRKSTCATGDDSVQNPERFLSASKKPRLSVPLVNLPNMSCTETLTPTSNPKAINESKVVVSNERLLSASKCTDLSTPPLSLPNMSLLDSPTPSPKVQFTQALEDKARVDDSLPVPVSNGPVRTCSVSIVNSKTEVDSLESSFQMLGKTVKSSNKMDLQILEAILLSSIDPDSQRPAISSAFPEVLFSKMEKEYESSGYKLFAPLKSIINSSTYYDESGSATALIIRTFILSQHDKMQDLLLFWSKKGQPVGEHLLYYVSRLAYEACNSGCFGNAVLENLTAKVSDSEMPLLKYHLDGYFSFQSGRIKESCGDVISHSRVDKEFVTKLVNNAFAAYRRFLVHLTIVIHKEVDTSFSKLLSSDLFSCCDWERKQLDKKFLFCSIFCNLSDISVGDEDIIRLLVSQLDDNDLVNMQFDISLKKYSIFGDNTEMILLVIKQSENWSSQERHKFWGLIRSELAVSTHRVEKIILKYFFSGEDTNFNAIAVGGLVTICNSCAPTPALVRAIMLLPSNSTFKDFSASTLATWAVNNPQMLFESLAKFSENLEKNGGSIFSSSVGNLINHSAITWLLDYFNSQGMNGADILSKFSVNTPER